MKPTRIVGPALAALCVLPAFASAGPGTVGADHALDRALDALVAAPGGPPGAIAVVQRGPVVRVHAAGVARIGRARAPRAGDSIRVASVSKAFTGAVALSLVRRGLLSLDATIGEVLPDLPAAWHAVTLRQLMNHTSGVPDFITDAAAQDAVRASPGRGPAPAELLRFVEDQPLGFTPGSRYRYSNSDNIIVGLMVAAAAGTSFETQLRTRVLQPLHLHGTSLPAGTRLRAPSMRGYAPDPPGPAVDVTSVLAAGWAWSAGGVVSTPADLNAFIRAYVAGRLAGPAVRDEQRRTRAGSSEPKGPGVNRTGLSVFRYATRCGVVWGHTGNTLGSTHFAAASPDGRRSATLSASTQINASGDSALFTRWRAVEARAACAALAR